MFARVAVWSPIRGQARVVDNFWDRVRPATGSGRTLVAQSTVAKAQSLVQASLSTWRRTCSISSNSA